MLKHIRKFLFAVFCLLCGLMLFGDGRQISSGFVTTGLLRALVLLAFLGAALFVASAVLLYIRPRLGVRFALFAAICGLPLNLDFAMPHLFRRIILLGPDEMQWYMVGDPHALGSMLPLVIVAVVAAVKLVRRRHASPQQSAGASA